MVGLCKMRRVGMIAAGVVSVGVGTSLVWHLVPEALRQMRTAELLGVVGLFLLPAGTAVTFLMERQSRRGAVRGDAAEPALSEPAVDREQGQALEGPAVVESDGAWAPVWEAVAQTPVVRHTGTGRREIGSGGRRPGADAGARRRREPAAAGAER